MVAYLVKIFAVLEAISVAWAAVSICKAVVFGSSMSDLPCKSVVSVSFEAISVVWFEVSSSNPVNAVCNPSVLIILKSPSRIKSCFPSTHFLHFQYLIWKEKFKYLLNRIQLNYWI
jgi:hypothetical protein